MVDQSSPSVRAATLRKSALSWRTAARSARRSAPTLVVGARREVGGVRRQVQDRGAGGRDRLAHAVALRRGEMVEHHDGAGHERRGEELLPIGAQGAPGHRLVQHQRRHDAAAPESGDEGGRAPVTMRHGRDQPAIRGAAAVASGHVGGAAGRVEEDQPRRVHEALPGPPQPALLGEVGPVLLGRSQGPFFMRRPIRRSAWWLGESPARTPKRRCSSLGSSARLMSGGAATSRRRSVSWGSSTGRRWPP
jgi:hypothetical protein